MQCDEPEVRTRGTQAHNPDSSSAVSQTSSVVTEKQTYYYSKFELFEDEQQSALYGKYRGFLERLRMQLGEDWRAEANLLVSSSSFGSGSKCIFEASLEVWLEINRMKKNKELKEEDPDINYENVYYEMFLAKLKARLTAICQYDPLGLATLAMGFFFSANEIWAAEMAEPLPKGSVLARLSQSLQQKQLFRPLMLVTQRIFTFFNKRVKTEDINPASFRQFRQTLEDEQYLEQKMRELDINRESEPPKTKPEVVFQKIPEVNPINPNLLQSAYKYIQTIINTKDKWQVARGFVTNILEINYNKITERVLGAPDSKEGEINVRVLKPAADFYHNLMVVWLLFRGSDYRIKFKEYLERVKATLGASWREKYASLLPSYLEPTKIFFSNLNSQWNRLTESTDTLHREDGEIIEMFVERVKENMKTEWEQNIVNKEGDFASAKML